METEEVAREHHLTQTEAGPEGGEKGNGSDSEAIEEEDSEEGVHETKIKDWNSQYADSKGRDHHIRREPHCPNLHQIRIRPLIFRYSFNSARLNADLENCSLDLGVCGVASEEDLSGYGRSLGSVDWRSFLWVCAIWRIATHVVVVLVIHYRRGMQRMSTSAGSREDVKCRRGRR